jgi:hypothetical protein
MSDDHTPSALERASLPLLMALHRLPRWVFFLVIGGLLLAGLFLENAVGGVLLLVLAVLLGWLGAVGWSHLTAAGRLLRLLTVGLLVFAGVTRIVA